MQGSLQPQPEPSFEQVMATPVGELRLRATATALVSVLFEGIAPAAAFEPTEPAQRVRRHAVLDQARVELREYFAGERTRFSVACALAGTPFQQRVFRALLAIPFGETRSYGQLAGQLGAPGASRAVGASNRVNPLGLLVPCHRVIGADGSLTGFAGGLARKRWLLDHERRVMTSR